MSELVAITVVVRVEDGKGKHLWADGVHGIDLGSQGQFYGDEIASYAISEYPIHEKGGAE